MKAKANVRRGDESAQPRPAISLPSVNSNARCFSHRRIGETSRLKRKARSRERPAAASGPVSGSLAEDSRRRAENYGAIIPVIASSVKYFDKERAGLGRHGRLIEE